MPTSNVTTSIMLATQAAYPGTKGKAVKSIQKNNPPKIINILRTLFSGSTPSFKFLMFEKICL